MINALTELYGEPEIIEIEELLSVEYKFTPQNGEYTVSVYPPSDFSTINVTILVNYFAVDL
ncbi:hypothetical protein [Psychroserpens mesophilus]|uniref:hypothetical protein n=1 Tax=Psychroserpens mesophilus TaxID=325473 RepID=UPI00058C72C7|nr:hypothetical protein [Psychroserpens mesophilus]